MEKLQQVYSNYVSNLRFWNPPDDFKIDWSKSYILTKPKELKKMSDNDILKYIMRHHFHQIIPHVRPPVEFWIDQIPSIQSFSIRPDCDRKMFEEAIERVDKLPPSTDPESIEPFYDRCAFYYSSAKRSKHPKMREMSILYKEVWFIVASHDDYMSSKDLAVLEYTIDNHIKLVDMSLVVPEELLVEIKEKLDKEFEQFKLISGSRTYIVHNNTDDDVEKISAHFKEHVLKESAATNLKKPIFDKIKDPRLQ